MPTFAVGAAPEYRNDDEGWGIPTLPPFKGAPDLSWTIINHLVEREFDIVTCQEMLVDHAFTLPFKLFWPKGDGPLTVPVCINTVQFPLPSARRCVALGRAVGEAVAAWDGDKKVVMIGSGGLSHQLEGQRAGFINKPFDLKFMQSMVDEPEWAAQYSILELVEKTGTQGVELINWLAARAAAPGPMRKVHSNYHIPISNTAAGMMALEAA
jgi:protocatechuate 4,5-dioxygenase beta chain